MPNASACPHEQDDDYGDVPMTILNFGLTIAETMKTLADRAAVRPEIESLVEKLSGHGH